MLQELKKEWNTNDRSAPKFKNSHEDFNIPDREEYDSNQEEFHSRYEGRKPPRRRKP